TDVEPVFGFLKANLRFTRMSVRGKDKVKQEMGFALMAVNLRKFTAMSRLRYSNVQTKRFRLSILDNRKRFYLARTFCPSLVSLVNRKMETWFSLS
ncbi:transposase, partial [Alkalicoccus chagannorensis]